MTPEKLLGWGTLGLAALDFFFAIFLNSAVWKNGCERECDYKALALVERDDSLTASSTGRTVRRRSNAAMLR